MKKNVIPFLVAIFVTSFGFSQRQKLAYNQNPNYKKSMDKYLKIADKYNIKQGITAQETYRAIDPLERRRERRALRKKYRANRSLWRHQERMEQAKHGKYYRYNNGYDDYYYNDNWYNNGYNGYYNRSWLGSQNLLNLGLLGGCIFN